MSSKNSHNQFMQLQGSHDHVAGEICLGRFTSVKNDFSLGADEIETMTTSSPHTEGQFRNDANWDCAKREKVKRFRFVVCTLSLMAIALSVMSRGMFNISIIEMTKDVSPVSHHQGQQQPNENELEPYNEIIDQTTKIPQVVHIIHPNEEDPANPTGNEIISVFTVDESDDENPEAGLHFSWSVKATNFLLSSFYFGYAPSMFLSGGIAEKYGSASLISICVLGSALINVFTPFMAAASYHALAASRILLGLLQGPLVPACYDIFNKWLTMTEMGAFVPLIKVSMAAGMIVGTMLPGFVTLSGHAWTYNFYIGGSICLVWLLVWSPLATSTPQSNSWMEESELQRIMRKKSAALSIIKLSNGEEQRESEKSSTAKELERATSIPWISIITSPSILVLTFVKFTYNLGMDFIFIESAIYLSQMHDASTETVALIVSSGCITQMALMSFVAGLATYVVRNKTFGLSKTNWRKIFQGTSNFTLAFIYLLIPLVGQNQIFPVAGLFLLIYFFWMFGAGGESMVPYDLSPKYPATIMGFAHSLSILSGFAIPQVTGLVLGDDKKDPERWRILFLLISGALTLGGLAFVLVIEAKPFLASERAKYDEDKAREKSLQQNGQLKVTTT